MPRSSDLIPSKATPVRAVGQQGHSSAMEPVWRTLVIGWRAGIQSEASLREALCSNQAVKAPLRQCFALLKF